MTGDIRRAVPVVGAVRVGGEPIRVAPLRLRDLAELQSWAASASPSPLDALRPALAAMGDEEAYQALVACAASCRAWPPPWGSPPTAEFVGSGAGRAAFLLAIGRRLNPGLDESKAAALAARATAEEWDALHRAIGSRDDMAECERLLGIGRASAPGREADWDEIAYELVSTGACTWATLGDLYLSQVGIHRRRGKPRDPGLAIARGTAAQVLADRKARFLATREAERDGRIG